MSSDYTYDETGQLWPYFVFTLATIITLPLTYVLVSNAGNPAAVFPRIHTDVRTPHADLVDAERAKYRRQQRRLGLLLAVVAGWLVAAYMMYLIHNTELPVAQQLWNPYDILGIADTSSEKAIKSAYKKLSRKFHPDKIRPDASKNETMEMLNDRYVEISKAYQALTDEDMRNNYLQYGHPDGKQGYSINIGLPKIMVTDGNGKYVVLVYFLLFGVLLPYLVGSWWYGSQSRSKEGVLMESANRLFGAYKDDMDEAAILAALSMGKEFETLAPADKADASLATLEKLVTATPEAAVEDDDEEAATATPPTSKPSPVLTVAGMAAADREALEDLDDATRRKVLALLWAYVGRVELGGGSSSSSSSSNSDAAALERAKFQVAPVAHALTRSMTAIALAYGSSGPVLASLKASQLVIQALPPRSASPLLQLPHVTAAVAKAIESRATPGVGGPMPIQRLMDLPDAKRRRLAVGPGRLTAAQYAQAVAVAQQLPFLRVERAFFKVTGERFIIPQSLVHLVVKGRFIPPGWAAQAPAVDARELQDVDPAEDDLEALLGRKNKLVVGTGPDGSALMSESSSAATATATASTATTASLPPLVYAPYYGREHSPRWLVFLTDSKQGKMVVPPFTFTGFDRPLFEEESSTAATGDGKKLSKKTPTFAVQTLKVPFVAPPQAGQYTFVMHVVCDSYVGFDTRMEVTLVVQDASAAAEMAADDEISDPEEDSLAGIMNAAKGAPVKRSSAPAAAGAAAGGSSDDDDDESGTDDDDDDTSDTNTDTEAED